MTAAHAGWGSETVPVGGGGAVCERLCAQWGLRDGLDLTVLGTGPRAPHGVRYHQLAAPLGGVSPAALSEWRYARMCREFERACTDFILQAEPTAVVCHDISEGPTFARLAARGIPVIVLVHVDVVEYFTRMYLRGLVSPERAVRFFQGLRRWPVVPDVLRLVFDKQWDCVQHGAISIVPSAGMQAVLARCYGSAAARCEVIGWGAPEGPSIPDAVLGACEARLRAQWQVRDGEKIILTLSRVSPEKGQDRVLDAIAWAERHGAVDGLRVVVCGGPAFMQGERFMRRLRARARTLRTPVVFAGHLDGVEKRAALGMSHLFVAASRHESYGLTTMEAFAAGLPAVAVDTHGARATVDDQCGRMVACGPDLPMRLWRAMAAVLADPVLRERLSRGARERAQQHRFSDAAEQLLARVRASGCLQNVR